MLTDMAPSAAPGQFYGSQIQTMGITNIAPHIQKAVSIKSRSCVFETVRCSREIERSGKKPVPDVVSCVQFIKSSRHLKASVRVTSIRNEERKKHKWSTKKISFLFEWRSCHERQNISKIWCRNQCSIMFSINLVVVYCCFFVRPLLVPSVGYIWVESVNHRDQREIEDSCCSFY